MAPPLGSRRRQDLRVFRALELAIEQLVQQLSTSDKRRTAHPDAYRRLGAADGGGGSAGSLHADHPVLDL
jgi:hypothetical protein